MELPLRELLEDIEELKKFALINDSNEIGQRLNRVLNYVCNHFEEKKNREKELMKRLEGKYKAYQTEGIVRF